MSVPKLRFPGFAGEWERKRLGPFIEEFREKSTRQDQFEVLTSARSGLMRQKEYYDNERISERDNIGFNVIPPDFLTYRSRSDDRRFYFNENTLRITGLISVYYPVFRVAKGDNKFFIELLSRHTDTIGRYSVGTSQTVLSLNELRRIKLPLPALPEQQKIAAFLGAVDAKLAALAAKQAGLVRYKAGLMQKLFSQQLRFTRDDGGAFPSWEQKWLGELGKFTSGGTPDTNNDSYWCGHIPWISSSDILENDLRSPKVTRFINDKALKASATKTVPANSILIVSRVGVGKLAISRQEVCTSQDFTSFTPTDANAFFLGYWMLSNTNALLRLSQGTSIKGLTSDDLKQLLIPLPHLDEQAKIADALSAMDAKIQAVADQITKFQTFKKGLLQQMFV
jgi:type I restriction enzyme S subunit